VLITEAASWKGHPFTLTWRPDFIPSPGDIITQASGVYFTAKGEMVLVEDRRTGERMLPGGHPEAGEALQETLAREVWEEACAVVEKAVYIGAQQVNDERGETYYQTRFWARVRLEPFTPRFETSARLLVKPEAFLGTLNWSTRRLAEAMLGAALEVERKHRGV